MDKGKNPQTPFPSDFVSENVKKGKPWILTACKAAHAQATTSGTAVSDKLSRIRLIKKYVKGGFDESLFRNQDSIAGNTTDRVFEYDIKHPIPTIRQNLIGQFENQGYKPKVRCLSPQAKTQYDQRVGQIKNAYILRQRAEELKKVNIDVESKLSGIPNIDNEEEIEIHLETTFKDDYTMAIQDVINFVLESNSFGLLKRDIYKNLVDYSESILKIEFDDNYDIRIRSVKRENHISDFTNYDDYQDAKWHGEYIEYTIDQLAELDNYENLTEEDLKNIAKKVSNSNGNPAWKSEWERFKVGEGSSVTRPYGSNRITLLDLEYKSATPMMFEEKTGKNGAYYFDRVQKPSNKEGVQIVSKVLTPVYIGKWIVGTDHVIKFGKKYNQSAKKINGCYTGDFDFGFQAIAIDIEDMESLSIMDRCIGLANFYIQNNLKAQVIVNKARPQGIRLDVSMLGSISNALGIRNITPKKLINMMEESSIYYFSSVTERGTVLHNSVPISEVPESPMSGLSVLAAREQGILKAFEIITGVPLSTIGAPDSDTLIGLQKAAAENRNNATRFINTAYKDLLNRSCNVIVSMVQDSLEGEAKKLDDYGIAIGNFNADVLKVTQDLPHAQFAISIEVLPDAVEQQVLNDDIRDSLRVGAITNSQAMRIRKIGRENTDLAEKMMALYENKNRKNKLEDSTIAAQSNAKANSDAATAAEKAKQETLNLQYELEANLLRLKYQLMSGQSKQDHTEDAGIVLLEGDIKSEHIELATKQSQKLNGGSSEGLRETSFPKEAGQVEPRVFPTETNI